MRKVLAILLSALLLIGMVPAISFAGTPCSVGDIITYGSYPQSRVTDSDLIQSLKEKTPYITEDAIEENIIWGNWNSYGYYWGNGEKTDGLMQPGDYMLYKDISHGGIKYRAVTFFRYRPFYTGWTSSTNSTMQDENGYFPGNVYYFKYEPLRWRVLDPAAGLVLCEDIIDAQAYQNVIYQNGSEYYQGIDSDVYANDYATSSLRQWLLNDFYQTAFSSGEQEDIAYTALDNSEFTSSSPEYNSASTLDKIFLLSYHDARNADYGFETDPDEKSETRLAIATDYARCQGIWAGIMNTPEGTNPEAKSKWWLRSPTPRSSDAVIVNHTGTVYTGSWGIVDGGWGVYMTYVGVRPAFCFIPGILEPYNNNECTEHIAGDPVETVLTPADCGNAGEKKVTVTCTVCGETISETIEPIPATGNHTAGEPTEIIIATPTCAEEGEKTITVKCSVCGATLNENTEAIPATGEHTPGEPVETVIKEADCGNAGEKKITVKCAVCGEPLSETTEAIPATGEHTPGEPVETVITPAACLTDGVKHVVVNCALCGATLRDEDETIPAIGRHTPGGPVETVITKADCVHPGEKKITVNCALCGAPLSETTEAIPATGEHTPGDPVETVVKAPTCTEEGEMTVALYCAVCGEKLSEAKEAIGKTEHEDPERDGVCNICGAKVCKYCQKVHPSTFVGKITQFFHNVAYFFMHLFGKM